MYKTIRDRGDAYELSRIEVEIPVSFNDNESDKKEQLYSIISQLDSNEKALILMYLDEYSYEEIAKTFNISTSNVGVKINRIKKKLSKISDNYGTE